MIEKAPKYVIDDLDNWSENPHNEVCIYALLNDMVDAMTVFVGNTPRISEKTARWVYAAHRTCHLIRRKWIRSWVWDVSAADHKAIHKAICTKKPLIVLKGY